MFDYVGMMRVVTPKSLRIVSSESGIPLNELNYDSVAVTTENRTKATEVSDVDPNSLDGVEEHEDLDEGGPHSNTGISNTPM